MAAADMAVLSRPERVAQTNSCCTLFSSQRPLRRDLGKDRTYDGNNVPIHLANQLALLLLGPGNSPVLAALGDDLGGNVDIFGPAGLDGLDCGLGGKTVVGCLRDVVGHRGRLFLFAHDLSAESRIGSLAVWTDRGGKME